MFNSGEFVLQIFDLTPLCVCDGLCRVLAGLHTVNSPTRHGVPGHLRILGRACNGSKICVMIIA